MELLKVSKSVEELENSISSIRLKLLTNLSNINLKLESTQVIVDSYTETLDRRINNSDFCTTGYDDLDEVLTMGFSPGHITVLAGRTGMGKSAFVNNLALKLSEGEVPVAYFTLEMSNVSVLDRMMAIKTLIPIEKFVKDIKNLTETQVDQVRLRLKEIENNKYLYLSDYPRMSLASVSSQVEKWKRLNKIKYAVVIIDLFGQLSDIDPKNQAATYEFALREAKILSMELNVHFILVAQISRKAEVSKKIWGKRPNLEDLKHSGGFEEVASIVLLLFRASYYNKDLDDDVLEVNIAKQREGPAPVTKYFIFNAAYTWVAPTTLKPYDLRIS